ncbi:hypothetical protein XM53_00905 [Roseovarius atlanticus]|uniref:HTH cro/C1-type domain-containing protein n=1 Tax=Roseovarius atlanticus TaxID=1641875 RepID=A0A0T5NZK3_9RHOB|nr:helix-turn-helix domain-containing protein [Roseovarius atlanticus]KRS14323.1 hypothetical protein XM53_00905 [Roseovarius atlanticus]
MCAFYDDKVDVVKNSVKQYNGKQLRKLRLDLELSLEQMSHLLDVSRTTVYRYEKTPDKELPFSLCCTIALVRQRFLH